MQISSKIQSLLFVVLLGWATSGSSSAIDVGVSIGIAPPPLPVYAQPPCPVDGYLWSPGYWAYDPNAGDYYWVPGVWVQPPSFGLLWTPGYWGCVGGFYRWNVGYWGPHCGFYGGVNYGCGYYGSGFCGGVWSGNHFRYNTAVFNVNRTVIHNTYVDHSGIRGNYNHTSFNGPGGIRATPSAQERAAMNGRHYQATAQQNSQRTAARQDRSQFSKVNNGRPGTTTMSSVNGHRFNSQGHAATAGPAGGVTHAAAKTPTHTEAERSSSNHNAGLPQHSTAPAHVSHKPTPERSNASAANERHVTAPSHTEQHARTAPAASHAVTHSTSRAPTHSESHAAPAHASPAAHASSAPHGGGGGGGHSGGAGGGGGGHGGGGGGGSGSGGHH